MRYIAYIAYDSQTSRIYRPYHMVIAPLIAEADPGSDDPVHDLMEKIDPATASVGYFFSGIHDEIGPAADSVLADWRDYVEIGLDSELCWRG